MIKLIKSQNNNDFENYDSDKQIKNPLKNNYTGNIINNKLNKSDNFIQNLEVKEDEITNTIIINGYFIHLNDIICEGENSIICKGFKEDTNDIYV